MGKLKRFILLVTSGFLFIGTNRNAKEKNFEVENAAENSTFYRAISAKDSNANHLSDAELSKLTPTSSSELENVDAENTDEIISPTSIGVTGSVSGTLMWTDAQGGTHPLIDAKVKVMINGSWWSAEQHTDENGYYNITYTDIWYMGSGKPTVHAYSENDLISVAAAGGAIYEIASEYEGSSGDWLYSHTFSPFENGEETLGKAMMIFQGANAFAKYAKSLDADDKLEKCQYIYYAGYNNDDTGYNGNNIVSLFDYMDILARVEPYASWDTIGHEYGHHVQKCFGFLPSYSMRIHEQDKNLIDEQVKKPEDVTETIKRNGLVAAWAEAWPTYWSTLAQFHFSEDYRSIATVGDTEYTSNNGVDYNLDEYNNMSQGEADECAVQKFLYKLYSEKTDEYDRFALGEEELWKIVTSSKPTTLYEFMQAAYERGYNKNDLGILLRKYNVIGGNLKIINNYLDGIPTFSWTAESGSDALRMNQFDLNFVDSSNSQILSVTNISFSSNEYNVSKAISAVEWKKIYAANGTTFGVYFIARQTAFFTSGNYYSELFTFEKPDSFSSTKIQVKPNEWGFQGRYYFQNEIDNDESVRYSTLTKGGLTITTDRLRCGYIESSYVILSPRREDAGYAYLEMNFDKPVYSFQYSFCLWSDKEYLNGDVVIEIKDSVGNWMEIDCISGSSLTKKNGFPQRGFYDIDGDFWGVRISATAEATGDRNKGRLCIDDLVFGISEKSKYNYDYTIVDYPKTKA